MHPPFCQESNWTHQVFFDIGSHDLVEVRPTVAHFRVLFCADLGWLLAEYAAAQKSISALNGTTVDNWEIKVDKAKPGADRDHHDGGGCGLAGGRLTCRPRAGLNGPAPSP
jgi:hypothetical protein